MPILKNVLGLDLGSHSLKAVELRQTFRGFEAVQVRSLPRTNDEVPLPDLVQRFVRLHRLSTEHVVTALPGDRISSRRLSFPFRDAKKLAAAVPFEIDSDMLFDLEDVVIDWEVVGGDRASSDVVATIAPRKQVSDFLEDLHGAHADPRTLETEGLVLGNLPAVFDLPGTRLLVDLGHRKTTCCLLVEGQAVASRTFAVGGAGLTRAIAEERGVALEEAERIKCEEGILGPGLGVTAPRAGAVLDELARELVRTLGSFEALIPGPGYEGVRELTLFGGTAALDRIDEYLSERTGLTSARLGLPLEGHGEGLAAGGAPTLFAPAIALALRGTAQARTRMNFRQDEFAMRVDLSEYRRRFGATGWLAVAGAVLLLLSFAIITALDNRKASAIEAEVGRLYTEAFPKQPVPANAVGALRDAVRASNGRAEFLGVYRGNLSALDLLAEISGHVPDDLKVSFEELTIDRQTIRMRVYSESFEAADRLGSELAKFPPFRQARIGAIETDRKRGGKRFNVTISLAAGGEAE